MITATVPLRSATARERFPAGLLAAAIAVAAAVAAIVVAGLALRDTIVILGDDFEVFHAGGSAVLNGVSPFDVVSSAGFLFIYPPFAAILFAPLGLLHVDAAFAVWTFASVLALEASIWLTLRLVEPDSRARRAKFAVLGTVAALPMAPVFLLLGFGQINALLMLLCLIDLARRPGRTQGIAIGIAAGIKLTPLIFIPYLLLTRRIRAAVVSGVTFVATVLTGFVVLPGPSARYWGELLLDTERMTPPGTAPYIQSMRGVLSQLPGFLHAQWFWLILATVVGVGGLALAAWAGRRNLAALGVMACAVTGLLISPVSWPPHWVWVVPALAVWLWHTRYRDGTGHALGVGTAWLVLVGSTVVTFLTQLGVLFPSQAEVVLLNSLPVLGGLAFLGVLAGYRWRTRRPGPAGELTAGRAGVPAG